MADFNLESFLPYQIAVLNTRLSHDFSVIYKEMYGISRAEWRVVAHLAHTCSVSVREIHKRADMDKSKVSRAAARLESEGYILKRASEKDKRLLELSLTDKGRDMVVVLEPLALEFERKFLQKIGADASGFRKAVNTLLAD